MISRERLSNALYFIIPNGMLMRYLLILVVLISKMAICSEQYIYKDVNLYAKIENENFFSYAIEDFKFKDSYLKIEYDYTKHKFIDAKTKLILVTNAPSYFNGGYEISVEQIGSQCVDIQGSVVVKDFAKYSLQNEVLHHGDVKRFKDFNREGDVLRMEKDFSINFDDMTGINVKEHRCNGQVVLNASLDF